MKKVFAFALLFTMIVSLTACVFSEPTVGITDGNASEESTLSPIDLHQQATVDAYTAADNLFNRISTGVLSAQDGIPLLTQAVQEMTAAWINEINALSEHVLTFSAGVGAPSLMETMGEEGYGQWIKDIIEQHDSLVNAAKDIEAAITDLNQEFADGKITTDEWTTEYIRLIGQFGNTNPIISEMTASLPTVAVTDGNASEPTVEVTAESAVIALREKISNITNIVVYDEETDPNGNLGRPGRYIGKADFFDDRIEDTDDNAGTIEFFSSESDCNDRYEYLCKLANPELGALGVNQYIYKYELAVFRVSFDLTPTQAEEYKAAMDEIMNEISEQYER